MASPISGCPDLEKGHPHSQPSIAASEATVKQDQQVGTTTSTPSSTSNWWQWLKEKKTPDKTREPRHRKLNCKERSYRSVATFLDSDENFMIYRRFGYLHSRMLLRLQDRLRALEFKLDRCDNEDAAHETEKWLLMSRDKDEAACRTLMKEVPDIPTRTQILDEIEVFLGKYDDWVLKAQQMVSLNRPAERDYQSVESHMFSTKPLVDEEYRFIYQKEDLITLRDGREMALLDSLTERLLRTFHCPLLQKIFCTKRELEKTDDPDVYYYSKSRKDCFNTIILCMVLISLLVLPIFVLYSLLNDDPNGRSYTVSIGVLLVFVLVFSAALSLFTKARRHEIFAAAAGYAAVLVVFFGNIS
ncbi:hypothetical protein PG997_015288 [Apiospora hydei]|uniref:DUF6594 domain-containing protein n=1 Tax=Apiospora hydei TaxID=1337664 RepID=A0ABR1UQ63_9PEZI